ncbi:related to manganese transport protein [Phialocephala subalpina]|uniref:Related to manganese transport protein n=1 Tax=Phialocephala subalpina TaxID=576137 RepID=A0A1L7XVL9_9HELO|nr:related to manganese transport protein [Phialocephala subalpina]
MVFASGVEVHQDGQSQPALATIMEKSAITTPEAVVEKSEKVQVNVDEIPDVEFEAPPSSPKTLRDRFSKENLKQIRSILLRFLHFTGPGTLISVAYVDPDNFQTALDAGAQFQYKLLCIMLLGVFMAIYLQALAAKLGSVTGLNLAQMNRAYLGPGTLISVAYVDPDNFQTALDAGAQFQYKLLCIMLLGVFMAIYLQALAAKLGSVTGLNLAQMNRAYLLRVFEAFVSIFIIGVFASFCIELSMITAPVGEVFGGYLPSKEVFTGSGPFQSCAILGGILMPHSLYLGSGLVQKRMQTFDASQGIVHEARPSSSKFAIQLYRPTLSAIKSCMSYSIAELCISLFVVTLFINSAILIVAASSLSSDAANADLPGVYRLFVSTIGQASGTLFACALLFSGVSAGIVCTMAGQLVCEGALDWRMRPFFRRLLTRSLSIIPAVIISASQGQQGLAAALNACNVVLSVALIFLTFPLIWYTSLNKYMRVNIDDTETPLGVVDGILNYDTERAFRSGSSFTEGTVSLANTWLTTTVAWLVWVIVAGFNVATLTFLGLGIGSED